MLFDETTLRKLNQLTLVAARVRAGTIKGERRSTRRGTSIEFADYRNYSAGDDLRRLDWNIYARLDRPFIKLLEEEEDLAVYILIDSSQSMQWGEGDMQKFLYARRLAAAIGAITLSAGDRLTISTLSNSTIANQIGPLRSSANLMRTLSFLEDLESKGTTDLSMSMRNFSHSASRAGLIFLISDLFSPGSLLDSLSPLLAHGNEITILHTLSRDEVDPPLAGDLRLVDIETGHAQEVSLDGGLRELYRRRVQQWRIDFMQHFRQRGIHYLDITTDLAWDKVILFEMRRSGLIKS